MIPAPPDNPIEAAIYRTRRPPQKKEKGHPAGSAPGGMTTSTLRGVRGGDTPARE